VPSAHARGVLGSAWLSAGKKRDGEREKGRRGDGETRGRGESASSILDFTIYLKYLRWNEDLTLMQNIRSYKELRVYQTAMDAAMKIFELSKRFPAEEKYSLTDQMRRSSRSVCTNIGEAWRKRRYPAHFISKMSDSEGEAEETRVWIEFAERCRYLTREEAGDLDTTYDRILAQLVNMIFNKDDWTIRVHSTLKRQGKGKVVD
jgi:four helix bundle protein